MDYQLQCRTQTVKQEIILTKPMTHNIPLAHVQKHTKAISDTKRTEVANLQNYIQEILGDHHTFLQGSYKNDTSTSDINDVDIVAVRVNTYSSTYSSVPVVSSIMWDQIFSEIENKLILNPGKYQWTVVRADKCIEVRTSSFKADVVPAVQINQALKNDNIAIYSFKNGIEKVNFPNTHYKNGIAKQDVTNQNYKPMVRMFKNWASNHFGGLDVVSSYHIESLVYNSPNNIFYNDHAASFALIGGHIVKLLRQRNLIPTAIKSVCESEDITANWYLSNRQTFCDVLDKSVGHALNACQAGSQYDAQNHWSKAFNL